MTELKRRTVLGGMAAAGLPVGTLAAQATTSAGGGMDPIRPVRLSTEHLTNPLGIESAAPVFGWQLTAGGTGRAQSAYQLRVGTDPRLGTVLWDTGKVISGAQTGRVYGGPPLRSQTRYHWSVRAWDEGGRPGPWSRPHWFETALRQSGEWTAEWVGSGIELPGPVRVLPPRQYHPTPLTPGSTLGQVFVAEGPVVGLAVLLEVPAGTTAGCTLTLHRTGPDGPVVTRAEQTGLVGDKHKTAQGRLDLAEPLASGKYFLEMSEPRGSIGWLGVKYGEDDPDLYPQGHAYQDGKEVEAEDRWLYGFAPPPPPNPLVRKEFQLTEPVASARLYLTGLGQAVAWVNGRRVGDAAISPVVTDYDKRLLYTTHDVTDLLHTGNNAVGIALGRGFFGTRAPDSDGTNLMPWVGEPRLRAQLEIRLASGRRITIASGPDWRIADGPTTYEGLFAGESYDARIAARLDGWNRGGFDDRAWKPVTVVPVPRGRLEAYPGVQVGSRTPVPAARVTRPAADVRVYDFGAVLSGRVRLRGRFPTGTTIRIVYNEKIAPNGRVEWGTPGGAENPALDGRTQVDEYTATGQGVETWEAAFTYNGFRYVEVAGPAAWLDVVAVPVHSAVPDTMRLQLDHPELQWIADAFRRTVLNGLHGYPDNSALSKFGWLGPVVNSGPPMLYQFGVARLFAHWLDDIRLAQLPSGALPLIAPNGGEPGEFMFAPSYLPLYPQQVHRHWLTYGDRTVPEKHFEPVRRALEWALGQMPNDIVQVEVFGDWYPPGIALGESPVAPEGGLLVGTAHVILALREGLALAELLGRDEVALAWRSRLDRMVKRFNEVFLDTAAGVYRTEKNVGYRQTSNAIPLAMGLVPAAHVRRVAANLVADVEARDRHFNTGAMGTGPLPYALSDHGRPDLAVAVLGQTSYPSYGYLRSLGATAFWESWEAHSRAHNDATTSAPVRWLVERAAGLEPLAPGWSRFRYAPAAVASLPGATITLDTVRGRIQASWRRTGTRIEIIIEVPVNAEAEVVLPNGRTVTVGSGRHRLSSGL